MNQDNHLKMDKPIASLCSRSFYQLYRSRRIRKFLTPQATQTLVHAFVTSNFDHCNSLFYGMHQYLLNELQTIQNGAARVAMLVPKFEHITPVMVELHWLPVKYRIMYKILLLVFKCLSGEATTYLQEMIKWHVPRGTLRSISALLLEVLRCRCKTLGTRSFRHAGPTLWNDLPLKIRSAKDINCFKLITCNYSYFCTVPRILYIL